MKTFKQFVDALITIITKWFAEASVDAALSPINRTVKRLNKVVRVREVKGAKAENAISAAHDMIERLVTSRNRHFDEADRARAVQASINKVFDI